MFDKLYIANISNNLYIYFFLHLQTECEKLVKREMEELLMETTKTAERMRKQNQTQLNEEGGAKTALDFFGLKRNRRILQCY